MNKYDLAKQKAHDMMVKKDKQRQSYYNYYSSKKWGDAASYHLCVDSSVCGIDGAVEIIEHFVELKQKMMAK